MCNVTLIKYILTWPHHILFRFSIAIRSVCFSHSSKARACLTNKTLTIAIWTESLAMTVMRALATQKRLDVRDHAPMKNFNSCTMPDLLVRKFSYQTYTWCRRLERKTSCEKWTSVFSFVFTLVARVTPTVKFQLGLEVNVIVLEIFKQDEPATVFIDQEISIKHG